METIIKRKFDLEDRLISFSIMIMENVEMLPESKIGNHLSGHLIRSSTSAALNYGEAQSAESRNDFIHKIKIILKELRETNVGLKIIHRKPLINNSEKLNIVMNECNELISIFMKSIETAKGNHAKEKRNL